MPTRIFTGRILNSQECKISSCGQRKLWANSGDAQADLSLFARRTCRRYFVSSCCSFIVYATLSSRPFAIARRMHPLKMSRKSTKCVSSTPKVIFIYLFYLFFLFFFLAYLLIERGRSATSIDCFNFTRFP